MNSKWYILFVRKNYELKFLKDFRELTSSNNFSWLKEKIFEIKFLESKDKNRPAKNLIPGYMFINCIIDKEVINFIYSFKEVVGFLNYDKKNADKMPASLSNIEVNNFFYLSEKENKNKFDKKTLDKTKKSSEKQKKERSQKEDFYSPFVIGEVVSINDGIFNDKQGLVVKINKNILTVNVEFLGRYTPVSIDSSHCKKV